MSKSLNIHQRLIAVQKEVTTVLKNDSVQVTKQSSYKAVSHDDVAALLHLPLANNGIVLLPTVTHYETSVYEVEKEGYGNKPNYIQRQYRTDLQIKVKWINADNPEDFIESEGGAFAIDSGDKGYAKAYSLALKIVLLKVHLLESRDGEEQRDDEKNIVQTRSVPQGNQAPPPWKLYKKYEGDPLDFKMPMGQDKGKALRDVDFQTLTTAKKWAKSQITKTPKPKNIAELVDFNDCLKKVIEIKTPVSDEGLGMDDFGPPPQDDTPPIEGNIIDRLKNEHGVE